MFRSNSSGTPWQHCDLLSCLSNYSFIYLIRIIKLTAQVIVESSSTAQPAYRLFRLGQPTFWKRKFSKTMLQIFEFSNLLCVIVLVILFFLIKMEGPLPARGPTESNEPRGSVRRSELNRNGERRWAGESENHSILPRRNYPTENDER